MRWTNTEHTAFAEITSLPGCPHIAVIHAAYVNPSARGCGVGTTAHMQRLKWAAQHGYVMALCTIDHDNVPQAKILQKCGWLNQASFINKQTGHWVHLYTRDLLDQL